MSLKLYSALYRSWHPLSKFYPDAERVVAEPGTLEAPGILILWGGSDIHPSLYNRANLKSYVGAVPSMRDQEECKLFVEAQDKGIPILGVCRGAQLACAMLGGILVQDVSGHTHGPHRITTTENETFITSSVHHQMMYPWAIDHELLAWSSMPQSTEYEGLSEEEMAVWPTKEYDAQAGDAATGYIEPEIVWFPQAKCLAVQGHPEYMEATTFFNRYIKKILDARCLPT